jgi:predicted dinucleotide-binding enzyme
MRIAILGTGIVGRTLADKLAALGHDVVIGTRDVGETMARAEPDGMGNPPYAVWAGANPAVRLVPYAEAGAHGELIINATLGTGSVEALRQAGAENLNGKTILDVSNALDFSRGFPPTLFVKDTDSLGEMIQRAFPEAKVVKSLNTVTARLMVDPASIGGGEHVMFVAGNDNAAKKQISDLLASFGWRHFVDLGDITGSRAMEMYLPLWLRVFGALGTPMFNFQLVAPTQPA